MAQVREVFEIHLKLLPSFLYGERSAQVWLLLATNTHNLAELAARGAKNHVVLKDNCILRGALLPPRNYKTVTRIKNTRACERDGNDRGHCRRRRSFALWVGCRGRCRCRGHRPFPGRWCRCGLLSRRLFFGRRGGGCCLFRRRLIGLRFFFSAIAGGAAKSANYSQCHQDFFHYPSPPKDEHRRCPEAQGP